MNSPNQTESRRERLRVLLVEDHEPDAELIRLELERGGFALDWSLVDNEDDLRSSMEEGEWDVAISDFAMPGFDGMKAFSIIRERAPNMPFIFVSGALGEERAVEAMRVGASDYLLKGNLTRLSVAVRREVNASKVRAREQRITERARQEKRRLNAGVEATGAGIFELWLEDERLPYVSPRLLEIVGVAPEDVPSGAGTRDWIGSFLHPDERRDVVAAFDAFSAGRTDRISRDLRINCKDGGWIHGTVFARALERDDAGRATHVLGVLMDTSEKARLEEQFRQAQKMEAVGRLAGGVAHDFNNLLTAIFSFTRFALRKIPAGDSAHEDLLEVLKAAKKAQLLTGRLLEFSRHKPTMPKVLVPNDVLKDIERILHRMIGEDIAIETNLSPELGSTLIDPGSFEQIIMNLAVNARDAMPRGGRLRIETFNTEVPREPDLEHDAQLPAGSYVAVRVSDDGAGMAEDTMTRIFEPFFTTKEIGTGTGLGLSTCYGIVKQAGGSIHVESREGKGTRFEILLPRGGAVPLKSHAPERSMREGGTETILVVEDEEPLRRLSVRALSGLGYRVLSAKDGVEAISVVQGAEGDIDLLVTDVVMPKMSGRELAKRLLSQNPRLKILFMSGYAPESVAGDGLDESGIALLEKPFTPDGMGTAVRNLLDE